MGLDELRRLIEWYLYTESDGYPLKLPKCYFWLALSGIGSQPTRLSDVLNLKTLKDYMRYQVGFLLPLKLQKIYYFGLCWKIQLANRFAEFPTFELFDLLILIPASNATLYLY